MRNIPKIKDHPNDYVHVCDKWMDDAEQEIKELKEVIERMEDENNSFQSEVDTLNGIIELNKQ